MRDYPGFDQAKGFHIAYFNMVFHHNKMVGHWNGAFWRKYVQNTFWLAERANNLVVVRVLSSG